MRDAVVGANSICIRERRRWASRRKPLGRFWYDCRRPSRSGSLFCSVTLYDTRKNHHHRKRTEGRRTQRSTFQDGRRQTNKRIEDLIQTGLVFSLACALDQGAFPGVACLTPFRKGYCGRVHVLVVVQLTAAFHSFCRICRIAKDPVPSGTMSRTFVHLRWKHTVHHRQQEGYMRDAVVGKSGPTVFPYERGGEGHPRGSYSGAFGMIVAD